MANHDDHGHGAHAHSARMYWVTYMVLAACTILTYTAAQHNFGEWSFAIAMFIALVKAMFVILFFMHLIDHPGVNRLVLGVTILFLFFGILMVFADTFTRFPLSAPHYQ